MQKGVEFIDSLEKADAIDTQNRRRINSLIDFSQWQGSFVALVLQKNQNGLMIKNIERLTKLMKISNFTEERIDYVKACYE